MSSFTRTLQRRALRKSPDYETAAQPTAPLKDGGYKTLRPTHGWLEISLARLIAMHKLAEILERQFVPTGRRSKPPKVWRKPAPCPAGFETRQQRRAAARGYVGLAA